jgi:hypothetical protein
VSSGARGHSLSSGCQCPCFLNNGLLLLNLLLLRASTNAATRRFRLQDPRSQPRNDILVALPNAFPARLGCLPSEKYGGNDQARLSEWAAASRARTPRGFSPTFSINPPLLLLLPTTALPTMAQNATVDSYDLSRVSYSFVEVTRCISAERLLGWV